jgi:Protein of unknown function (DUF3071)
MQDLRLIGVHEDGQHLLIADAAGGRYRLTLDDALRAAARRDRPRLGQLQIEIEGGLRPRDVQALVRSGLSTEEVADRAGWTVEKVRRFEGPVLAEREHVASRAQQCAVGSRGTGPVTLAERVAERLRDRGVDRGAVQWDSARDEEGAWSVTLAFLAGGRERTATWHYEPLGGSVTASNDEARWLSEDPVPGAIPAPHQAPHLGDLDVYDVDADGGLARGPVRSSHEPIDLMAAMRESSTRGRRSRRRPAPSQAAAEDPARPDELPIAELALDPAGPPPPAVAADTAGTADAGRGQAASSGPSIEGWDDDGGPARNAPPRNAPPRNGSPRNGSPRVDSRGGGAPGGHSSTPGPEVEEGGRTRPASPRRGRPSVPSWDDIVFGTRGEQS